jgi:hypothetical protein
MEELMTMLHTIFPDKEVYDLFITTCSNLETPKIVYFFGEGSNGKSTICRLLQLSFGDIFSKIHSKLLENPITNRDFQRYRDKKILCTELNQEEINLQCLKELRCDRTLIIHSCRPPSFPDEILQRTIIIPFRHYFSVDDPQLPKKLPQFVKPFVELLRKNGSSLTYKENI